MNSKAASEANIDNKAARGRYDRLTKEERKAEDRRRKRERREEDRYWSLRKAP